MKFLRFLGDLFSLDHVHCFCDKKRDFTVDDKRIIIMACNKCGLEEIHEIKNEIKEEVKFTMSLKEKFLKEVENNTDFKLVVVAVKLPTGAIETISNTQFVAEKILYYINAYDSEFKLKNNPEVQIVGYMLV